MYTNVSEKFKKEINKASRTFKSRIKINNYWYTNIKSVTLTQGSCDEDNITIGSAVSSYIEVTMKDIAELFENTEVELQQGLMFSDGSKEYITMGYYTAQRPQEDNGYIKFTAYDRMQRFEKVYTSKLTFPATAQQVLDELCKNCDIETDVKQLETVYIQEKPQGYTCREVVGYIASLYGKFAIIERTGKLAFKFYEVCNYDVPMSRTFSLTKNQADYKVEYLYCNIDNSTQLTQGSGSRGITFNNPYVTKERLAKLYTNLNGFTYRPATIKFLGDIRLDVWDIVKTMDLAGNTYNIPVMKMTQTFDGGVCTTIEATGKTEEEVNTDFKGPVTKGLERTYTELLLANTIIATKVDADWVRANTITTGKLEAVNAEIEYLKANKVDANWVTANTITADKLEAVTGRIEILEANALTANSAEIKSLKAGVADINTLMFGTATGGSLTAEFSNSIVGLIGDAQIKSAMIKDISADKILSGKLYTNLVEIVSQGGNLDIADNTIQIMDNNKTARVQIGKDASGDYNIYIWDKNGKLMFDPLYGVQESGIKKAIIRNDMISNTANISGEKIDIASLITTINKDGSNTINASKVLIDTNNQTLDVSFKNLTTSVSTVSANVTTALNTANMAKNSIDNMQIGGRNLLPNSTILTGAGWGGSTSIVTGETDPLGSNKAVKIKGTSTTDNYRLIANVFKENGYYTISFWAKASKAFNLKIHEGGNIAFGTAALTTTWKYYTYTLNVKDANTNNRFYFGGGCSWKDTDVFVYIAFPKLEKGNKATDWSPAPEDVESKIATVESKLTTQGTQLTAIQGNISSKIWQQDITTAVTSLEIGGRNLVRNSNFAEGNSAASSFWNNWGSPAIREFVTLNNKKWCHIKGTGTALYQGISQNTGIPVEKNTQYTVSIRVKGAKDNTVFTIGVHWNTTTAIVAQSWTSCIVGVTEKIVTATLRTPNADINRFNLMLGVSSTTSAYEVYFTDIKMEKGNKASDWSPAPEDVDKAIATLEGSTTTLSTKYAEMNETLGGISATVVKNTKSIEKKADGSTVETLQDNVSGIQIDIDKYKTTVANTYATKTDFNNIQIGGRNLLLNTNKGANGWRWSCKDGTQSIAEYYSGAYAVKCVQAIIKTVSSDYSVLLFENINRNKLQSNKQYTLTFDIYSDISGKFDICYAQDTRAQNCGWFGTCNYKAKTWVHFAGTVTFNSINPNQKQCIYFANVNSVGSWIVANLKLEEGNKSTAYSAAPEDTDALINTLQSNVTNIQADLGGYKTTVTNTYATKNTLNGYATTKALSSAINQKANSIIQSVSATYATKTDFNNMQIGGRNFVLNSTFATQGTSWVTNSSKVTYATDSTVGNYIMFYCTAAGDNLNYRIYQTPFADGKGHVQGQQYTLSFYAKASESSAKINCGCVGNLQAVTVGATWSKYTIKYTASNTSSLMFNIAKANVKLYLSQIKLEKGNKATDWSPAPEDTNKYINAKLELKIDKVKLISEINASADEIKLTSNRLSWTSTNTTMTKEGYFSCVSGKIGDYRIESGHLVTDQVFSDGFLRRVYIQKPTSANSWVYSVQKGTTPGASPSTLNSIFRITASGDLHQVGGASIGSWLDFNRMTTDTAGFNCGSIFCNEGTTNNFCVRANVANLNLYSQKGRVNISADSGIYINSVMHVANNLRADLAQFGEGQSYTLYIGGGSKTANIDCNVNDTVVSAINLGYHTVSIPYLNSTSDLKCKNILKNMDTDAINLIMALRPIEYYRNDLDDNMLRFGFGAQEVFRACSMSGIYSQQLRVCQAFSKADGRMLNKQQIQSMSDKDIDWKMSYEELIAPLVYTVQQLYKKVEQLKQQR